MRSRQQPLQTARAQASVWQRPGGQRLEQDAPDGVPAVALMRHRRLAPCERESRAWRRAQPRGSLEDPERSALRLDLAPVVVGGLERVAVQALEQGLRHSRDHLLETASITGPWNAVTVRRHEHRPDSIGTVTRRRRAAARGRRWSAPRRTGRQVRRTLLSRPVQVHHQCLPAGGELGLGTTELAGGPCHGHAGTGGRRDPFISFAVPERARRDPAPSSTGCVLHVGSGPDGPSHHRRPGRHLRQLDPDHQDVNPSDQPPSYGRGQRPAGPFDACGTLLMRP